MNAWPSGWREAALRESGIEPNNFNVKILHLWEQATPTDRWTNNPVGMPSSGYGAPRALKSAYAAFPTMGAFRKAFAVAAHQGHAKPLYTALGTSESMAELYRVIHALEWPANGTETDYPATILDAIEGKVRESLMTRKPADRKTVGGTVSTPSHAHVALRQAAALHHAAYHISRATDAIQYLARKLG